VYRKGAASTFMPWTYVKPSSWVSCLSEKRFDTAIEYDEEPYHDSAKQKRLIGEQAYLLEHAP
jgi:hypothetical protein